MAELIELSANENLLGPSPKAVAAVTEALGELQFYTRTHDLDLMEKLAAATGGDLTADQFVIGNGSGDVLRSIVQTHVLPGDAVILPRPSFIAYQNMTNLHRGQVIDVPLKEYQIDLPAVLEAITPETKLIFICNPNNPTGQVLTHTQLAEWLPKVPEHVLVVVDEAYHDFHEEDDFPRMNEFIAAGHRVVVARTFSKVYGLASLRVGYGYGHKETIEVLRGARRGGDTGRMAYLGAAAALTDEEHIVNTLEMVRDGRNYFYAELEKLGINYLRSHAFFVLLTNPPLGAQALVDAVRERGIAIRHTDVFNMPGYVRISIGRKSDNEAVIAAITAIMNENGLLPT